MRSASGRLLVGALLTAGLASALPFAVQSNDRLDSVRAERIILPERFAVERIDLIQAILDAPAVGTQTSPAELTEAATPAGTTMHGGDWAYVATVRERTNASAPTGEFVLELAQDGRTMGSVWLQQNVSDPAVREGARVWFDLGPQEPQAPLFVLRLILSPDRATLTRLTSTVDASLDYVWQGDDGMTNPSVTTKVDAALVLRAINGDGTAPHALQVLDSGGKVLAGPTPDVTNRGDQQDLSWAPPTAGTFRYQCRYHPTMEGNIQVGP